MVKRVAIVGGGMGGLAAAYELTRNDLREKYDVTVYQMGWRLGGKCATGRNLEKNMRIEEHGIHAFAGSYYNALTMMKHVFAELDRDSTHPIPDFETAFKKVSSSFMWDYHKEKMEKTFSNFELSDGQYTSPESFASAAAELSTLKSWAVNVLNALKSVIPSPTAQDQTHAAKEIREYKEEIDQLLENTARLQAGDLEGITVSRRWLKSAKRLEVTEPMRNLFSGSDISFGTTDPSEVDFEIVKDDITGSGYIVVWPDGTARSLELEYHGNSIAMDAIDPDATEMMQLRDAGVWFSAPDSTDKIPWHLYPGILEPIARPASDDLELMRNFDRIEFIQLIMKGIRDDELEGGKFHEIDHEDFHDWLERHGAQDHLMRSPYVAATVFTTYQFPDGDLTNKPTMSASSYVQWVMRMGSYIDSMYYFFTAGSGETLMTPLYDLLIDRGVKIELFHELTDVVLNGNGSKAEKLKFNVQAKPIGTHYNPFEPVKGLRAWPNRPLYDRLLDGHELQGLDLEQPHAIKGTEKTLTANFDFDSVILAIPPKALAVAAPSLVNSDSRWKAVTNMPAIPTQSMQLWLRKPTIELADFHRDIDSHEPYFISGNYRSGLHGIGEFDEILEYEDWPENDKPLGLAYFSGVMTRPHKIGDIPTRELADLKARHTAETMLTSSGSEIFPNAASPNPTAMDHAFDFNVLFPDRKDLSGVARLSDHYIRGNALPSELYTQAPPGTKSVRIDPLKPPQTNMTGAGDWVDTRLNIGSVEGAVIGGRLAACFLHDELEEDDIMGIQL